MAIVQPIFVARGGEVRKHKQNTYASRWSQ